MITNDLLSKAISEQLQTMLGEQIICEPAARNTAPAAGLAAFLIERTSPDAVLGVFPAGSPHRAQAAPPGFAVPEWPVLKATAVEGMRLMSQFGLIGSSFFLLFSASADMHRAQLIRR